MDNKEPHIIARNRKANFEYQILETIEAGIELRGTEVKSVRMGKISLGEGWVEITEKLEAWLQQVSITPYSHGNIYNHKESRPRRLLLRKKQLRELHEQVASKGFSIVPLRVYLKGQYIKVLIGLGKGKKNYDKRETSKEREASRSIERALKQ